MLMRPCPEVAMNELKTIDRALLSEVSGGAKRVAHPRASTAMNPVLAQLQMMQMQLQAAQNNQDPLMKILPLMIAMRKGDMGAAMAALTSSPAPAAAPAAAAPPTETA
jgi:hypothetical protein